jgi:16S rRNA (cytidine1402-2'-O)-methyltransferase
VQEHPPQLFIETPYRNEKLFKTLCQVLRPQTRLCIAAGITTADEWIRTLTVAEWRRTTLPDLSKTPAIFLFGK